MINDLKNQYHEEALELFNDNAHLTLKTATNMYVAIQLMLEARAVKDLEGSSQHYEKIRSEAWRAMRESVDF